ncbi:MAG: bifunctional serine/threonine-protein kinase/formylglycine-generating enzyme family protein, partial [Thermoguttaceae bacterium]
MPKTAVNVETVFAAALELPPAQRGAYLAEACGGDERLCERVERLLAAHDDAGRFLDVPAMGPDSTVYAPPLTEKPGTVIGRYKLLEQVGEGGFGVVFMAEQEEPVRRKVALKIIKPGMDSKEVIARFEAEEQALALMDHPNIARVLDAGATDSGRPYFVMELVRGKPITDYCDECDLPPEQRLELFVSVCHAVQHAHQKGIIHRDLKPSNVLVTLHDGEPVVKVIDFGVAKAINQRLTEKTLFTRFAQMVGTPLYMSPEQAEMSGLDVDTRTDIYSLGVLLYELLTGSTPFDRKRLLSAGYDEIRRIIREEEPVKPSTKISTQREVQPTGSSRRHIDRKRLSAMLRGDLDWIVMKALEKDRRRRYETAKDFASDIQHFLNHEAVEATPPSVVYRVRKFVRRHRVGVAATVMTGVFVLVIAAAAWKSQGDREQRELADLRASNAELQAEMDRANAEADRLARAEADRKRELAEQSAANLTWLNDEFFPGTERLKSDKQWAEAFAQAQKAADLFPQDPRVHQVWQETSCRWTVTTDPPGSRVLARPYGDAAAEWTPVGTTPLDRVATARGFYHWKIECDGFRTAEGCAGPEVVDFKLSLDTEDPATAGMVRIASSLREREVDFFLDRYEVTNREFKRFVDRGTYANPNAWRYEFYESGTQLPRDQAMARFVDRTGKPGPSTWANGTYPPDEDNLPVRGISWYEAAAYAGSVNKLLPTIYDWQLASGANLADYILPVSNYSPAGPVPVGSRPSIGPFGNYDMAGNVREWCFNEGDARQRYVLGGAWDEPAYMFNQSVTQSAMDRSETNGFRCALYLTPPTPQLLAAVIPDYRDYTKERPLSDSQFETIRRLYAYASKPLNAQVSLAEETERYRHEVITFDANYGDERVTAHLFLPRRGQPPYQTIVYFPGADARQVSTFYTNAFQHCNASFALTTGRAVLWPVYKGHFERHETRPLATTADHIQLAVQQEHDLRAAVDYLYERDDIDRENLAYFGSSAGARVGPIMLAMEDRFKTGILLVGGFNKGKFTPPPELDPFHFTPRVKIPVLMINGRMDDIFPYQVSQLPMFNALGTPAQDKGHRVFPGGHSV